MSTLPLRPNSIQGRDDCAARLRASVNQPEQAAGLVWQLSDWECDLAWVDAELKREAA